MYRRLVETVPGLEDRLASSPDELSVIAELVGRKFHYTYSGTDLSPSYAKGHQEPEAMTPRA